MGLKQKEEAIINLVINGQQAKASLKEITGSYNALTAEIRSMKKADDPAAYEHKIKVLDRLRTTLSSVKDEVNGGTKALAKWKTELAAVATGVIGGNIITSISEKLLSFIPNMINSSAELSDQLSDIQKTTGMSEGAVDRLNAKLSKIDTRTKTKELRDIAINAGQLGIAKDDVLGFTTAVDKANVALGDEFDGGAGEVSNTLGKLRNVLLDVKSDHIETDILHIGNALNVLGAEGLATSPVVADFAGRIGGVGIQMGLTSGQVLGLSATMQELNISTERGSTAVITILQRMLTNYKDFAKVAGLSAKDFKKLADNDLYGAFMKVVDGANRSKESSTGFAKLLDKLKIDGAGASEVISKLGGSQDLLTSRVGSATEALKGQSSIINEFNLKNNNLAANWEKLSKRFSTMWNSSAMKSFFSDVIGYMAGSETAAQKAEKKFYDLKEQVDSLTSTMPPLLDRYDQLKAKTMLNKDEHTELKTIIDKVTSVIPGLATEVDKYGHIMSMSTTEARNFIEVQKNLLQYQNQDAIKRTTKDLEEYKEKLRHFRTELATGWTEDAINKYFTGNNKGLKLCYDGAGC
jgi:TP901 family phage tail tape measure protein